MRTNVSNPIPAPRTFEGSPAHRLNDRQSLFRAISTCMLWEDQFYENGVKIEDRIATLSLSINPEDTAAIARYARNEMKLRHAPLWIARSLANGDPDQKSVVASLLYDIIQRPDEMGEFLSLYWKNGKTPISAAVKRGLAKAFTKFNTYSLAKYNRNDAIKLRDILFLTHAKPLNEQMASDWRNLINGNLPTPDTWEVSLSATKGENKQYEWVRLLRENKLGALALLRNLRNMIEAKVPDTDIRAALVNMKTERVLPFRFITAARHAPKFEPELEGAMLRCLKDTPKLPGKTAIVVDTSPSMWQGNISVKSELSRFDAAAALSILCREICEDVAIYTFDGNGRVIAPRRGFALRDAMDHAKNPQGGSFGNGAVTLANRDGYDRIIVLTDGEWHFDASLNRRGSGPAKDCILPPLTNKAYLINVASYQNAIGSGKWTMIDGWSEALIDYIRFTESDNPILN